MRHLIPSPLPAEISTHGHGFSTKTRVGVHTAQAVGRTTPSIGMRRGAKLEQARTGGANTVLHLNIAGIASIPKSMTPAMRVLRFDRKGRSNDEDSS